MTYMSQKKNIQGNFELRLRNIPGWENSSFLSPLILFDRAEGLRGDLPAVQFQQLPAYGALNFKDQYSKTFTIPWPVIGNIDAQLAASTMGIPSKMGFI